MIIRTMFKLFPEVLQSLKHRGVPVAHTDQTVPLIHLPERIRLFGQLSQNHIAPSMTDPGRQPDHHDLSQSLR